MNFLQKIVLKTLLRSIGKTYDGTGLNRDDAYDVPVQMFSDWFQQTLKKNPDQANIMTLSSVSLDGHPSSRLVLLKSFDQEGFVFFTNYTSKKAQELNNNPNACLSFWWETFFRQVRIEGKAVKISAKESDKYFATRDRTSQLGAWASHQSKTLTNRAVLEERVAKLSTRYHGKDVPRPPFWGGYRLVPSTMEFWQGRLNRLHDRFQYTKQADGSWELNRLSP